MKSFVKKNSSILVILICLISLILGCQTRGPVIPPERPPERVCFEESEYFGAEFSYPCEKRKKAQAAGEICNLLGISAYALVAANREYGPTAPETLYEIAGVKTLPIIEHLYDKLGESAAKTYISYIRSMSIEIAQKNITDLVTYPKREYQGCIEELDYSVVWVSRGTLWGFHN